nr:hypothetical protein [Kibdelosporangium sp. MJ126-NF4]CEL18064.1 hypothetical protein [Kibdelosporangium sp. MJ126-NF4]CTQ90707.1 hypothetical protein [Kibdelosporangium sp. MJ126-NF4]
MADQDSVSDGSDVQIDEESGEVEEVSAEPTTAGMLSVVYADGPESPPRLILTGAPGVPETLLVVDESGTPVAQYTAGPPPETRHGLSVGAIVPAAAIGVVPAHVPLSDRRLKADIVAVDWSR